MTPPGSTAVHREAAADLTVHLGLITVSDTRNPADDRSGSLLRDGLVAAGHHITAYDIVPDEPDQIRPLLLAWVARDDIEVVVLNGGTGIARRDRTFDVVDSLLGQRLPGFGELFRMLSFEQVGAAAMLSRAVAGVIDGTLVFSLPGSPKAVSLALERLMLPELRHLVWELRR